jgi:AraC family transcriptional regulator of adaptative response / DNA-3-methyladenine glycosylase II
MIRLAYRPPLDWSAMLAFLAPRATPGVEVIAGDAYRRTAALGGRGGWVEVRPGADGRSLALRVAAPDAAMADAVARVRRLFDLDADPRRILRGCRDLPRAARGLRVPGAWDPFELAVRAILGQQVTVRGATTLAGRLVERFGRRVPTGVPGLTHLFPAPETLARADVSGIGVPRARAATIRALAAAVCRGVPLLDRAGGLDEAVGRLRAVRGIGPWTAHYIAMRACGEPDAFPGSDLGLRRALGSPRRPLSVSALARRAEAWRPWRAYAAMRLWTAGASPDTRRDHAARDGRMDLADRKDHARRP